MRRNKGQSPIQYVTVILVIVALAGSWMAYSSAGPASTEGLAEKEDISSLKNQIATLRERITTLEEGQTSIMEKIGVTPPPRISVMSVSAPPVKVGEEATITVSVINTGGESGTKDITLKVAGESADTKTVTVPAGESKTVPFSEKKEKSGDYTVSADGSTTTWSVAAKVPISLTIWGWKGNAKYIAKTAKETGFTEEYPNIKLNPVDQANSSDTYDKLTTASITGKGAPDLVGLEVDRAPYFVNTGIMRPLDKYGAAEYADMFPEWFWNYNVQEGKVYAIPWDSSGASGLWYRSDIFQKYDLEVPDTMNEWVEEARKLKEANADMYMTFFGTDDRSYPQMLINSMEGQVFRKTDGGYETNLDSAKALKAMRFMDNMVKEGLADACPMWVDEMYSKIKENVYASVLAPQWYGGFLKGWMDANRPGVWKIAPFPSWEKGEKTSANWGGTSYGISTQSDHPKAAWKLLKWVFLNKEHAKVLYKKSGYLPAIKELQTDPDIAFKDDYFGGQNWNKFFAENIIPHVPSLNYTRYYDLYNQYAGPMVEKVLLQGVSPEDALAEMADLIEADMAARK